MGLKNYTTKIPAAQSLSEIQEMLVRRGASGFMSQYEQGTGRIAQVAFSMDHSGQQIAFRLPLRWREARQAMKADQTMPSEFRRRADRDEDYVYRVAWRILRDWIDAQMAVVDLQMVQVQEVFLPYAVARDGRTLYENMASDPSRLLGSGNTQ